MSGQSDEGRRRSTGVPGRARPSEARAAAAARLVGAAKPSRATARASGPAAHPSRGSADTRAAANWRAGAAGFAAAGMAALKPEPRTEEHGRPEEQGRPRHLKVVPAGTISAAQRRRRARAVLIASIGAATVIAFALVYLHVVLAQRQFRIDRLNADVAQAQTNYQNLRLQVAGLGSPQQIISTAEGRLGMVQPTKVEYLTPATQAPASGAGSTTAPGTAGAPAPAAPGTKSVVPASQAPAGDADWPTIKSQLAGTP